MGTNSKLHVQFSSRHWESLGCNGDTFADTGYQNTWDVTRAQPGRRGILVDYTGGDVGASFGTGTPAERAAQFLSQIEPVLPGITGAMERSRHGGLLDRLSLDQGLVLVLEGRPVHAVRRVPSGCRRVPATSPASTPRSTSRAT